MQNTREQVYYCIGCGKTYTEQEYQSLPTTRLPGKSGTKDWPTCPCETKGVKGNKWFLLEKKEGQDDDDDDDDYEAA